jgi:hypothetical protein
VILFRSLILDVEELGLVLDSTHGRSWRFILKASFMAYGFSVLVYTILLLEPASKLSSHPKKTNLSASNYYKVPCLISLNIPQNPAPVNLTMKTHVLDSRCSLLPLQGPDQRECR